MFTGAMAVDRDDSCWRERRHFRLTFGMKRSAAEKQLKHVNTIWLTLPNESCRAILIRPPPHPSHPHPSILVWERAEMVQTLTHKYAIKCLLIELPNVTQVLARWQTFISQKNQIMDLYYFLLLSAWTPSASTSFGSVSVPLMTT